MSEELEAESTPGHVDVDDAEGEVSGEAGSEVEDEEVAPEGGGDCGLFNDWYDKFCARLTP